MKQTLLLPSDVVLDCYTVSSTGLEAVSVPVDPKTAEAICQIKSITDALAKAGLREVSVSFTVDGTPVSASDTSVTYTNNQGQKFSCEFDPEGSNIVVDGVSDEILRDTFEQAFVAGNSRYTMDTVIAARKEDAMGYNNNSIQRQWAAFYNAALTHLK